ncbi:YncE family protein [Actinomadura parmotrematis]|uniref:YncE family protein n=1 Tax=Actinomadura parmotrematis TaxID=2864039 RepID=A0ABS7FWK0_9ACTN|nr:hypothetical protein [Actinomadura parmotrematis]MBW8484696.1 hypothetical protein [Actinomadura parmotrematis]
MTTGRGRGAARLAAVAAAGALALGCESPVPFYRPGAGAPDGPVAALGAPAPYVAPGPRPLPSLDARTAVYAGTGPGMLAPAARRSPPRLYVAGGGAVAVVDARTGRVVRRVRAPGADRVTQSWDLRRLWTTGARTGPLGRAARPGAGGVLYFTPDGREAMTLDGRRLVFRAPGTLRARGTLRLPCAPGHADFSADGAFMLASCGSGRVLRIDPARRRVTGTLPLPGGAAPGDLRLAPDGAAFFVADAARGGVWTIDGAALRSTGFTPTGAGARALALSRDARRLFVLGTATLAAVDTAAAQTVTRWPLPPGGPLASGGVSADGSLLWLMSAARGTLYALSTGDGRLLHRFRVGGRPRSVTVLPQPGRHTLGGPGLYR